VRFIVEIPVARDDDDGVDQ